MKEKYNLGEGARDEFHIKTISHTRIARANLEHGGGQRRAEKEKKSAKGSEM